MADDLKSGQMEINTWVHRTRKALARTGYPSPATIVERQEGTGRLRIGASDLMISRETA